MRPLLVAAILAAMSTATGVMAAASSYTFEPVKAELQKGDDVTVAVRIVEKSSKKPVPDAVIVRTRIDMGPDGMPTMEAPLAPARSSEPGAYSFKTSLPMAGHWLLSIAAKVQGEPETVVGKVTYTVIP